MTPCRYSPDSSSRDPPSRFTAHSHRTDRLSRTFPQGPNWTNPDPPTLWNDQILGVVGSPLDSGPTSVRTCQSEDYGDSGRLRVFGEGVQGVSPTGREEIVGNTTRTRCILRSHKRVDDTLRNGFSGSGHFFDTLSNLVILQNQEVPSFL